MPRPMPARMSIRTSTRTAARRRPWGFLKKDGRHRPTPHRRRERFSAYPLPSIGIAGHSRLYSRSSARLNNSIFLFLFFVWHAGFSFRLCGLSLAQAFYYGCGIILFFFTIGVAVSCVSCLSGAHARAHTHAHARTRAHARVRAGKSSPSSSSAAYRHRRVNYYDTDVGC